MRQQVPVLDRKASRLAHSSCHRGAFTLVELLVVIGIIALLVSVLLPSLNKARAAANSLACSSNMRTIGQFFAIYQSNNKGNLPPAMYYNGGSSPWYGTAWPSRISPLPKVSGNSSTAFTVNVSSAKVFTCPVVADSDATGASPLQRTYVLAGMSYYAPASFRNPLGKNNMVWGDRSTTLNGSIPATFQLKNPAKMKGDSTVSMMEVRPRPDAWNGANSFSLGGEPWGTMDFYDWVYMNGPWTHNFNSANFLFLDGHVESITPPIKYRASPDWYALYTINSGRYSRIMSVNKSLLPMDVP